MREFIFEFSILLRLTLCVFMTVLSEHGTYLTPESVAILGLDGLLNKRYRWLIDGLLNKTNCLFFLELKKG